MFKEKIASKFLRVIIWVSGYLNFIAFVLVGGYFFVKNDESRKKLFIKVFYIVLIFLAVSGILELFNYFGTMFDGYFMSGARDFYDITTNIVEIARIVVFGVFTIIELTSPDDSVIDVDNDNF